MGFSSRCVVGGQSKDGNAKVDEQASDGDRDTEIRAIFCRLPSKFCFQGLFTDTGQEGCREKNRKKKRWTLPPNSMSGRDLRG